MEENTHAAYGTIMDVKSCLELIEMRLAAISAGLAQYLQHVDLLVPMLQWSVFFKRCPVANGAEGPVVAGPVFDAPVTRAFKTASEGNLLNG